jgi:protein translocase SecG subunit
MLNILFIIQFGIALLLLFSVLIQRTGKQSLAGFENSSSSSLDNNFIIKFTWILLGLFFLNSIILGNIAAKNSKQQDIIKIQQSIVEPKPQQEPQQNNDNLHNNSEQESSDNKPGMQKENPSDRKEDKQNLDKEKNQIHKESKNEIEKTPVEKKEDTKAP